MSECEGDADLEGMAGRVMELEGQLQEKEAIMEALHAEIDDLRTDISSPVSSQSQRSSSLPGREVIYVYHNKLQEFERAVRQRDNLIEDLTASLQQALSARDVLLAQVNMVNSAKLPENKSAEEEKILKDNYELSLKKIQTEYEEKLKEVKDENRLLESRHAKELAVFQSQLIHYKNTVETLKQELVNCSSCEESVQAELNIYKAKVDELRVQFEKERATLKEYHQQEISSLNEHLKQCKLQLEDITAKYVAINSSSDPKESIETSLERSLANTASLKQQNDQLKFQLNEMFERYSGTNEDFVNNRVLNISRLSNNSFMSESNQTIYETFNEMGVQYQVAKQKLDEKMELEKQLVDKITNLEEQVIKAQQELQEANLTKRSYEKQLKDMKNTLDKLSSQTVDDSVEKHNEEMDSNVVQKQQHNTEYTKLKQVVQVNHKLEKECEKLKQGLAMAWSQCTEFTQHLNQSFTFHESKLSDSALDANNTTQSKDKSEAYVTTCDDSLPLLDSMPMEVTRLLETQTMHVNMLKQLDEERELLLQEIDKLRIHQDKIEDLKKENKVLIAEIAKLDEDHKEEIALIKMESVTENNKLKELLANVTEELDGLKNMKSEMETNYAKKMKELRVYFEKKCSDMEKQYSEEIFSQQSKKMQDESDNDNSSEGLDEILGNVSSYQCEDKTESDEDQKLTNIVENYESRIKKLTSELDELKKQNKTLQKCTVNKICQTECKESSMIPDSITIHDIQNETLDLVDSSDSEALNLYDKKQNREELEEHRLKKVIENQICAINENDIDIFNILSEVNNEQQQLQSSAAIDAFRKTQLLCKTCIILNDYLEEIIKYTATCEKEINNCLVKEQDNFKHLIVSKFKQNNIINENIYDDQYTFEEMHFVPQLSEISVLINDDIDSAQNCENMDKTYLEKLRLHLKKSLTRLRDEINRISSACMKFLNDVYNTDHIKSICDTNKKQENICDFESLISSYQKENEQLKAMLLNAQQRLYNMEKRKEIITEGYGEQNDPSLLETDQEIFSVLERAKAIIMNEDEDDSPMIQVIEELYKYIEHLKDSTKREKDDLQFQIEAADKQLRATRKFLEEQASERENERDEAAKEIKKLQEHLREKEREKERDLRITSELQDLIYQVNELEESKIKMETECKVAADKVSIFKEIIAEREQHIKAQDERESLLQNQIEQLEDIIAIQTKNQEELAQELENLKSATENTQVNGVINHLQDELKKHQMSSEYFNANSSAMKQMKLLLQEMQTYLDKRTKELEMLHVCGSNLSLSQPSEDVSIRDHVDAMRCPTPDDPNLPQTLPLDHLLRLKEKLLKNGRAEEVALKRIKDLDMQLNAIKSQNEELQAEHEMLQQTTSEQLFQIEALRSRFEQQKQNEPFVQKQVTSRLEFQLHESTNKLQSLERIITDKELEVIDLKARLDRANQLLQEKEAEMANLMKYKEDALKKLRDRLDITEDEKKSLELKMENYERVQINLIDTMLLDKNEEIDHLKEKLAKKDKELEDFVHSVPDESNKQQNDQPKNSARTLSDILSIHSECEDSPELLRAVPNSSQIHQQQQNMSYIPKRNDDHFSTRDISVIPPLELESITQSPRNCSKDSNSENNSDRHKLENIHLSPNSLNISSENKIQELQKQIHELNAELEVKTKALETLNYEMKICQRHEASLEERLQDVIKELQDCQSSISKSNASMEQLQIRNKDLENNNKLLNDYKKQCEAYTAELNEVQTEISRLHDKLKSRESIITCLEELARYCNLLNRTEDESLQMSILRSFKDKNSALLLSSGEDNKNVYKTLEIIQNKLIEPGCIPLLKKQLNKEKQINATLRKTIMSLEMQIDKSNKAESMYKTSLEQCCSKESEVPVKLDAVEKDKTEKSEKCNSTSTPPIDQEQLENIIEKYNYFCSQFTQFQKINDDLKKQKENIETKNEILKSQIAEYEKRIIEIKTELDEKNKQIYLLDKEIFKEKSMRKTTELNLAKQQQFLTDSQQENVELISCLRKKLSSTLTDEENLQQEVTILRQKLKNMETHINGMQNLQQNLTANRNEEMLNKSLELQNKLIVLKEEYEHEKRNNEKLQGNIKKIEAEKLRLKENVDVALHEKEYLVSKLALVECTKEEIQSNIERLKAQFKSKEEECQWLQKRNKVLAELDVKQPTMKTSDKKSHEMLNLEKKCITTIDNNVLQYFYGKYQRSESKRKALIYQKRYLLCVLTGFQHAEENTLAMLARLTNSESKCLSSDVKQSKRIKYFKSVVFVIISIHRMKWLITKWRIGKQIVTDVILKNAERNIRPMTRIEGRQSP